MDPTRNENKVINSPSSRPLPSIGCVAVAGCCGRSTARVSESPPLHPSSPSFVRRSCCNVSVADVIAPPYLGGAASVADQIWTMPPQFEAEGREGGDRWRSPLLARRRRPGVRWCRCGGASRGLGFHGCVKRRRRPLVVC